MTATLLELLHGSRERAQCSSSEMQQVCSTLTCVFCLYCNASITECGRSRARVCRLVPGHVVSQEVERSRAPLSVSSRLTHRKCARVRAELQPCARVHYIIILFLFVMLHITTTCAVCFYFLLKDDVTVSSFLVCAFVISSFTS